MLGLRSPTRVYPCPAPRLLPETISLFDMQRTRVGHLLFIHGANRSIASYVAGNVVISHSTLRLSKHGSKCNSCGATAQWYHLTREAAKIRAKTCSRFLTKIKAKLSQMLSAKILQANALESVKDDTYKNGFVLRHLKNQNFAVMHRTRLIRIFNNLPDAEKFAQFLSQHSS